jgi:hypothetical protein
LACSAQDLLALAERTRLRRTLRTRAKQLAKCPVPTNDVVFVVDEAPDDDDVHKLLIRADRKGTLRMRMGGTGRLAAAGARYALFRE